MPMFRIIALSALAPLLSATPLMAQLSGRYTIDPSGSGARNFSSFAAVAQALSAQGVAGPVVFQAQFASSSERLSIPWTRGTSATNTVTFRADGAGTRLGSMTQSTVEVRAQHVVIDGFEMDKSLAVSSGQCILVEADDCEIKNCKLSAAQSSVSIRSATARVRVHHNEIRGHGVVLQHGQVRHNRFFAANSGFPAIVANSPPEGSTHRVEIFNNVISGHLGTGTAVTLGDRGVYFWHNTVAVFTSGWAILIRTAGSSEPTSTTIRNNIIDVGGRGGAIQIDNDGNPNRVTHPDFNLYSIVSTLIGRIGTREFNNMPSWRRALSLGGANAFNDRASFVGRPRFDRLRNFELYWDSPAVDRANTFYHRNFSGPDVATDFGGWSRGVDWRDLGAHELAGFRYYGEGCAGAAAKTPRLEVTGDVGPTKRVRFQVSDARPATGAFFVVGTSRSSISLGGGCKLLTAPLQILPTLLTSSGGVTAIEFHLPRNHTIDGSIAIAQVAVLDAAAASGVAVTRGVEVRL